MHQQLQSLWTRLSIVEARIQQEKSRRHTDEVRLSLLKQMKADLHVRIRAAELRDSLPLVHIEAEHARMSA